MICTSPSLASNPWSRIVIVLATQPAYGCVLKLNMYQHDQYTADEAAATEVENSYWFVVSYDPSLEDKDTIRPAIGFKEHKEGLLNQDIGRSATEWSKGISYVSMSNTAMTM